VSKARYRIDRASEEHFELFEDGILLVRFTRQTFRKEMEDLQRSSNWVGAMLRLFLKQYPLPSPTYVRTAFERLFYSVGELGLVDYLRSKGLRVVKNMTVPDAEIIRYLELQGYAIEGLIGDIYYNTKGDVVPRV